MKHFVITGPESTGKSTLAGKLSHHFNLPLVEEFARTYINSLTAPYTETDLEYIGHEQIISYEKLHFSPTIFDTDLLTTYIWMEVVYDKCRLDWMSALSYDTQKLYLLCKPDIPWVADPQRENPHDRDRLYEKYKFYLELLNLQYTEIYGDHDTRMNMAIQSIEDNLSATSL